MKPPEIESFHHAATGTWTHVVSDPATGAAAVVDPVLDYDAAAGRTATTAVDALVERVRARGLRIEWILETHAHADHLSAAPAVQAALRWSACARAACGSNGSSRRTRTRSTSASTAVVAVRPAAAS